MFSRLNWKLTFSYTLVTVGTLVVLGLCALLVFQLAASSEALGWIVGGILQSDAVPRLREALSAPERDMETLNARLETWLPVQSNAGSEFSANEILSISAGDQVWLLDPQGRLLAHHPAASGERQGDEFNPQRIPGLEQVLPAALAGETSLPMLSRREDALITVAIPIPFHPKRVNCWECWCCIRARLARWAGRIFLASCNCLE
jgi:hypothetical protein